jgi:hypothetical protein
MGTKILKSLTGYLHRPRVDIAGVADPYVHILCLPLIALLNDIEPTISILFLPYFILGAEIPAGIGVSIDKRRLGKEGNCCVRCNEIHDCG